MSEQRPPRAADPAVTSAVGFIGLGSMGSVLARNLVEAGHVVVCHDLAGADRAPAGASFAASVGAVAAASATVVLSLPDGLASAQVVGEIVGTVARTALTVVETSTIGVVHARNNAALLETAAAGGPDEVGRPVTALWQRFADQRPGADFTAIYPFVAPEDAASD